MRRDTKLAIVIGLIVVGFGSWYITLPDVSEVSSTDNLPANKAEDQALRQARDKADSTLAKGTDVIRKPDEASPGTSLAKRDLAEPASRLPDRRLGGLDPAKVDAQRSMRLALPRSFGQSTSQPAGAGVVGAITTRPAVAGVTPGLAGRKAPQKPQELYKLHVIQAGDNYSALAKKYLGHAKYAPLLAEANPGMQPRRLMIGAKIKIPNLPVSTNVTAGQTPAGASASASPVHRLMAEPAPSISKDRAYKIEEGEGWSALAERYLGDSNRWPELYELNRERVPHNPNILPAGTMIELPKPPAKK